MMQGTATRPSQGAGSNRTKPFDELERALEHKSPERKGIFDILKQIKWFNDSALSEKLQLVHLPLNFDPLLRSLPEVHNTISQVYPNQSVLVLNLYSLLADPYAALMVFKVLKGGMQSEVGLCIDQAGGLKITKAF